MFNLYSEEELHSIYLRHVKLEESYFKKYEKIPECPIKSWNYSWGDKDMPRAFIVLDFIEWINKYNIQSKHLGYTSDTDPELEFLPCDKKTLIEYPPNDLHKLQYNQEFDFFLFNQTIEHLYNPFIALKNIYNSLKEGGYVFTSVPTINIPHMTPIHFNGYNPMGLALLFKSVGFEIVEMGQFGNFRYIEHIFKHHHWAGYNTFNVNGRVENEERNACQSWILARKMSSYSFYTSKKVQIDMLLDHIFKQKTNGVFIELGANDGIRFSNTAFFEFNRGWKGILIEPSVNAYNECVKNRPNSQCFNLVCVSDDYKDETIKGDFNGGMMSSVDGKRNNTTELVECKVSTLEKILDSVGATTIDFLSLDTEGYEYNILCGLNLNKYRPKYMLIEIYNYDYVKILYFLETNNYSLVDNITNYNKEDNPGWDGTHNDYLFVDSLIAT